MTLVIPSGNAQIIHRFSLAGDPEEMLTTYGVDISTRGDTDATIAAGERDRFLAAWPPAGWSDEYVYLGVRALIGAGAGPPAVVEAPSATPGLATMNTPPQNCCVLVKKQSLLGGRGNRGRMFWPPFALSEANVASNGMLDPDFVADTQLLMDALATDLGLRILHDSTSPGALPPTEVTSLVVDGRIATQRRRLR